MIAVIGDIILDITLEGTVDRISPEAPIPVITNIEKTYSLGGAANVALNIHNLNKECFLYGAIGNDYYGKIVTTICEKKKLKHKLDIGSQTTTIKKRYVDKKGYYLLREDRDGYFSKKSIDILNKYDYTIIVASDYGKGVLSNPFFLSYNKMLLVDTKKDFHLWQGAYLIKPNIQEFYNYFNTENMQDIPSWLKKHYIQYMLVTKSKKGMTLISQEEIVEFPGIEAKVSDVTGAGDTVIAVLAALLDRGYSLHKAIEAALYAATNAVKHKGVYIVSEKDIPKTVFINGVFDILHTGHITLLNKAKKMGTRLIVGINSDNSVKKLKGSSRPINTIERRIKQLDSFGIIDEIIVFDADTPLELIKVIEPDIYVMGAEYKNTEIAGIEYVKEISFIDIVEGFSTSNIIERVINDI